MSGLYRRNIFAQDVSTNNISTDNIFLPPGTGQSGQYGLLDFYRVDSFTMTTNSFSGGATAGIAVRYTRCGTQVTLLIDPFSGTIANSGFPIALSDFPNFIWPSQSISFPIIVNNDGATGTGRLEINFSGGAELYASLGTGGFLTGPCGIPYCQSVSYNI